MDLLIDYGFPVLLFVLGFGASALAGRKLRLKRDSEGLRRLPIEGGGVRLDLLARGEKLVPRQAADGEAEEPPSPEITEDVAGEREPVRRRAVRPRKRR